MLPGFEMLRLAHAQQRISRAAAAWLNAPQEQFDGGFRTFSPGRKSATVASQSSATLVPHSSSSTPPAQGSLFTDADGYVWIRVDNGQWKKLGTGILRDEPWRR